MDSLEFIHRFSEAMQASGNRPVEVKLQSSSTAKGISIRYEAGGGIPAGEKHFQRELPLIVITHPL